MTRGLSRLSVVLAATNALFWTLCVVVRDPLGPDYFRERDSRYRKTAIGVEWHLVTDVDPMLVLAERPFAYPMTPETAAIQAGLVLNMPAFLIASLATELLTNVALTSRSATWVGTITFLLIGTAQWLLMGSGLGWLGRRRRRLHSAVPHRE